MPPDDSADILAELGSMSFDGALGRRIIETHIWAVREGLRGATAYDLFDGYCQRLVVHGTPLWRAHTAMETLHPQWGGYGYTWRRDLNAIEPEQYAHGSTEGPDFLTSPLNALILRARDGEDNPSMRRRLEEGPDQRDFPALAEFFAAGATDYFAQLFIYGKEGDRSQGTGIVYSFATDRKGGFSDDDATLIDATLPALSLAMKAHAAHVIASGLLGDLSRRGCRAARPCRRDPARFGRETSAVLWYADIRGFTPLSDAASGPAVVDLLNDVFEVLTSAIRPRGGQVLKFIGDGMLATFSFEEANRAETCRRALDAAAEAMQKLEAMNAARAAAGALVASVDLALHLGEVLYGNVGATDRLDFTVIGPAINEVARIEVLVRTARPRGSGLGRIRRRGDRLPQPSRAARPPRAARRAGAEGDFRAQFKRRAWHPSPKRTRSRTRRPALRAIKTRTCLRASLCPWW